MSPRLSTFGLTQYPYVICGNELISLRFTSLCFVKMQYDMGVIAHNCVSTNTVAALSTEKPMIRIVIDSRPSLNDTHNVDPSIYQQREMNFL